MTTQHLINLQGVNKVFSTEKMETTALDNIHLTINQGEYVSISGPSGCGKSTLLSVMGLLHSATEGKYFLNGAEVMYFALPGDWFYLSGIQLDRGYECV